MLRLGILIFVLAIFPRAAVGVDRPNILFLLADDQRPDTISALGNDRIETPHLDALARQGLVFTRATCSYPICVISRAEMLSGQHGWENGVDGMTGRRFHEDVVFWGDALQQGGYRTWTIGKWHVSGRPAQRGYSDVKGLFSSGGGRWWKDGQTDWKGFPITGYRGWVFQSGDRRTKFPERGVGLTPDIDAQFADAAIEVIEQSRGSDRPWFLHVNFTGPHDPLFVPPGLEGKYQAEDMEVPENFLPRHPFDHGNFDGRDEELLHWPRTKSAVRDLLRVYYSVIDHLDQQVGRILEALERTGQRENTYVIYSSDHGMAVGSHGLRGKQNMYEHTINVPFIVAGPGIEAGSRTPAQIYLRDLYPTTCELAGVPVPDSVTATSFAPVLRGERDDHHDTIFGYFRDSQRMIRTDRWKYIEYPQVDEVQLFDLAEDPFELRDLAEDPEFAEARKELADRLMEWRREQGDLLLEN